MDFLFVNPNAGEGKDAKFWRRHLAAAGIDVDQREINDPAELDRLTSEDRLLVAGGDVTVTRLVPGCIAVGCTVGVLPSGTGNDFARGLGVPLEPDDACRLLVTGCTKAVDVGVVGEQCFLNVAHVGIGSEVSRQVDDTDKRSWGRFSYLRHLLRQVQDRRGFKASLQCGDRRHDGRWLEIAVANGRSFGGGHEIVGATPFDGRLDVLGVRPRSLTELLVNWLRMRLLRKRPPAHVVVSMRGSGVTVSGCKPGVITADGEQVGHVPACFDIRPGALRVVVPGG